MVLHVGFSLQSAVPSSVPRLGRAATRPGRNRTRQTGDRGLLAWRQTENFDCESAFNYLNPSRTTARLASALGGLLADVHTLQNFPELSVRRSGIQSIPGIAQRTLCRGTATLAGGQRSQAKANLFSHSCAVSAISTPTLAGDQSRQPAFLRGCCVGKFNRAALHNFARTSPSQRPSHPTGHRGAGRT
ncbi:hypothetical protein OKW44_002326 [Paraburkholderia sp. WSM4174]